MAVSGPHAVRSWWRYSGLVWWPLASNVVLASYWWLATSTRLTGPHGGFVVILAVACTALGLAQLGYGTVRAERARRYGCW